MQLTDGQRRRLAAKGKPLGHKLISKVATIVTPDTIIAWHRSLIALKWTYPCTSVGRPGAMEEIRKLIVGMAEESLSWGYCQIQGGLKSLDRQVARSKIAKILRVYEIAPAPDRPARRRTFIKSYAAVIAGTTTNPTSAWMAQAARNLTDRVDGFLKGKRYMSLDRDAFVSEQFKAILMCGGTRIVQESIHAPSMNAFAERVVLSIRF